VKGVPRGLVNVLHEQAPDFGRHGLAIESSEYRDHGQ
jgi:hypothetical protein